MRGARWRWLWVVLVVLVGAASARGETLEDFAVAGLDPADFVPASGVETSGALAFVGGSSGGDAALVALRARDGSEAWRRTEDGDDAPDSFTAVSADAGVVCAAGVHRPPGLPGSGETLLVACYSAPRGARLWVRELEPGAPRRGVTGSLRLELSRGVLWLEQTRFVFAFLQTTRVLRFDARTGDSASGGEDFEDFVAIEDTPGDLRLLGEVATAGPRAFVAGTSPTSQLFQEIPALVALDARDGAEAWRATEGDTETPGRFSAVAAEGGVVCAAGVLTRFVDFLFVEDVFTAACHATHGGSRLWSRRFASTRSGFPIPALTQPTVQVARSPHALWVRIERTFTGEFGVVLRFDLRAPPRPGEVFDDFVVAGDGPATFVLPADMATFGSRVFVAGTSDLPEPSDAGLVALRTRDGDEAWRAAEGQFFTAVTAASGAVCAAGTSTRLVAGDLREELLVSCHRTPDGALLWERTLDVGAGPPRLSEALAQMSQDRGVVWLRFRKRDLEELVLRFDGLDGS